MKEYLKKLTDVVDSMSVTSGHDSGLWGLAGMPQMQSALLQLVEHLKVNNRNGNKVIVIGNGGSAAIASHVAIDLNKNAGIRALALNDASALTCLSNDYGYDKVFAKQIEYHGRPREILVAISSSGKSLNILKAVEEARLFKMYIVTFSGFEPYNQLRQAGNMNFYVPSSEYGFVELAHQIFLHAVTDALGEQRKAQDANMAGIVPRDLKPMGGNPAPAANKMNKDGSWPYDPLTNPNPGISPFSPELSKRVRE